MPTPSPATPTMTDPIAADIAVVRGELSRIESKASALLGIAGAGLTVILAAAQALKHLPTTALVPGAGATVADAVAIGLLLWSLLPRLGRGGWLAYADLTPDQAAARATTARDDSTQLVLLARMARGKYRAIRMAVVLLFGVVALVLAAAAAVAVGEAS